MSKLVKVGSKCRKSWRSTWKGMKPGIKPIFSAASVQWRQEHLLRALELFACTWKRVRAEQCLGQADVYHYLQ